MKTVFTHFCNLFLASQFVIIFQIQSCIFTAKGNEIYPGIRPAHASEGVKIHSYYQWVWIMLIAQTVAFYFPHWAWEKLERGTTMMLVGDLNLPMLSNEKKRRQRRKILTYLHRNEGYHQRYALYYALSEMGNLVNIILQLVLTDYFLDNSFTTYGLQVFQLTLERPYQRDDRLARVFPTVTACRMATGGVAFGREVHDILCVLSINIIHEKVYIVLWFWFIILLIASILCLVYRLLTLHKPFRAFMLKRRTRESAHHSSSLQISTDHKYGEWFLIYRLSQNMDPVTFGDLVADIANDFQKSSVLSGVEDKYAPGAPPASVAHSPVYVNTKLLHV